MPLLRASAPVSPMTKSALEIVRGYMALKRGSRFTG